MAKKNFALTRNPLFSGPTLAERVVPEKTHSFLPYREIDIDLIDPDRNQPRVNFDEEKLGELVESIKTYGVLSPILVKPSKTTGRFSLIAGERRLRASKIAGLIKIPTMVRSDASDNDEKVLAIQLVENLQRAELTPLERAHAIGALKESYNLSIRDVAEKIGISKSGIQRSLDLLNLPDDLLNALREGASESKILMLAEIKNEKERGHLLKDLDSYTRSRLAAEVDRKKTSTKKPVAPALSADDEKIRDDVQRSLGLKISIARSSSDKEKGKISIEFYSKNDLQELYKRLVDE